MGSLLRSINSKFYTVVVLLVASFGLGYVILAYFLHQQSLSYEQVDNTIELKRSISTLNESFHKARFYEKEILNQSDPGAEKHFGSILQQIRILIEKLNIGVRNQNTKAHLNQILTSIDQYEAFVGEIIQLNTKESLLETRLKSTFQSMTSTILQENDSALLRSLFSVTHFFITYQNKDNISQYKALQLVTKSLEIKVTSREGVDSRLIGYVKNFEDTLQLNHEIGLEIISVNQEVGETSLGLNQQFERLIDIIENSLQEIMQTLVQSRTNLQTIFLVSTVFTIFFLIFVLRLLRNNIIRPIGSIARVMALVQAGTRTARFHHSNEKTDEIIEMGLSLNTMLESIETRDKTLVEYQRVLEQQLRELSEQKDEQERLTLQLQRVEKMEAIGTLAGGVAHDLNNILSGIVNYPELLLLDMPVDSPYRKSLIAIQESGYRAVAIVQDLLTLARRGAAVLETINLNKLIKSYLDSPEGRKLFAEHPLIDVQTDMQEDLFNTKGSPVHLLKTVMNLVTNGIESIKGDGVITIKTENRYISRPLLGYDEVEEGDYVSMTVKDTGQGIADNDLERIFEPFFTKKQMGKSGSGLGLAVVWGTIKDHHGYIDVQSHNSSGTTFTLYFPITREEIEESNPERQIESYMGNGETILIVDDVQTQRDIASNMLEKLKYNTCNVTSGEEAIAFLTKYPVDLIVLDMLMPPGIDGLETLQHIVKIYPQQKAIIASGYSETERVLEAQRLGAAAYIRKPYSLEMIGLAIKQELEK